MSGWPTLNNVNSFRRFYGDMDAAGSGPKGKNGGSFRKSYWNLANGRGTFGSFGKSSPGKWKPDKKKKKRKKGDQDILKRAEEMTSRDQYDRDADDIPEFDYKWDAGGSDWEEQNATDWEPGEDTEWDADAEWEPGEDAEREESIDAKRRPGADVERKTGADAKRRPGVDAKQKTGWDPGSRSGWNRKEALRSRAGYGDTLSDSLQNPERLRQAVVLSEVLGDPASRKRRRKRMEERYGNQGYAHRG